MMGQGEDNMIVWNREKFTFPVQYPPFSVSGLALWTMPVAAAVVAYLLVATAIAFRLIASQIPGAA